MTNNNAKRNRTSLITRMPTVIALILFACSAAHAQLDRCVELARNLQVTSERVADIETFESQRIQFCNEIRDTQRTSDGRNISAAFNVLGLSQSSSSNSVNEAFSKYCRDEGREESAGSHYREYFRGVAPGAYDVLLACEMASRGDEGLRFEMLSPPTHNKLSLNVSYRTSQQGATATLRWNSNSAGADGHLDCRWEDDDSADGLDPMPQSEEPRATLTSGQSVYLRCHRTDWRAAPVHQHDYVEVSRTAGGGDQDQIAIPWIKYDGMDIDTMRPIQTMVELQEVVKSNQEAITTLVEKLTTVLTGQQQFISREWHKLEAGEGAERRRAGRQYVNDRQYPIEVAIVIKSTDRDDCMAHLEVQDVIRAQIQVDAPYTDLCTLYTSVPPGARYKLVMGAGWPPQNTIQFWNELR